VPSGVFIGMAVEGVSLWPRSKCCCDGSRVLALQHFPWGAGGFVPEVSSLIPQFEFPRLNDILNLCFILTLYIVCFKAFLESSFNFKNLFTPLVHLVSL